MTEDEAVLEMVHELGHAAGLDHEHQRPDAHKYIQIHRENIRGYNTCLRKIGPLTDGTFVSGTTAEERMDEVWKSSDLAIQYFENALPFMNGNEQRGQENNPYSESEEPFFDFDSVMIYSSDSNAERGTYSMTRKAPFNSEGELIWQGGHPDPKRAMPSRGDIERIKQLYPIHPTAEDAPGSPDDDFPGSPMHEDGDTTDDDAPWSPDDDAPGSPMDEDGDTTDDDAPGSPEDKRALSGSSAGVKTGIPSSSQWNPVRVSLPGLPETIIRPPPPYPTDATRPARNVVFPESPDWRLYIPKISDLDEDV
ncbi:hypothetical protein LTR37_010220 [Vermiconidia calcicola]|uniref:Uncharacterized protein n=1 Tax=Vermiconidia calcicola TaxID=1690605 RepID=A0ACC3N5K0_9PEZI|nr:hypothetical protein LTR37_010220 [Vermiconidia calcicola]